LQIHVFPAAGTFRNALCSSSSVLTADALTSSTGDVFFRLPPLTTPLGTTKDVLVGYYIIYTRARVPAIHYNMYILCTAHNNNNSNNNNNNNNSNNCDDNESRRRRGEGGDVNLKRARRLHYTRDELRKRILCIQINKYYIYINAARA